MQKNLKLVSCRIDPDTLEKIDHFVARHTYWTRNAVINKILSTVINRFDERDVYDMVRSNNFLNEHVTALFRMGFVDVAQKDSQTQ